MSDAILLGSQSDGVVLCVRAGSAQRDEVKSAVERLRLAEVRILGSVLNAYRPQGGTSKRSQSYHYYPYERSEEADSAA